MTHLTPWPGPHVTYDTLILDDNSPMETQSSPVDNAMLSRFIYPLSCHYCILISLIEQKWLKFLTCSYDRVVDKDILREFNVNAVSVRATFWSCYMHILNQNITTLIYHYMVFGTVNGVNVANSTSLAMYDIQCLQYTV